MGGVSGWVIQSRSLPHVLRWCLWIPHAGIPRMQILHAGIPHPVSSTRRNVVCKVSSIVVRFQPKFKCVDKC
jgi:hypothetical protein